MHYLHFKHHIKMVKRLWKLSGVKISDKFAVSKFSTWLGGVIILMTPLLKDIHYRENSREFQYELIHENRKLKRKSLWAKLPEELYQRLKLVHKDLNRFSIAQLVRELIREYLRYLDSEEGLEFWLRRLWQRVDQREKRYRKSGKPIRNKLPSRLRAKKFHMRKNLSEELPMVTYYDPGGNAQLIFLC